MGKHVRSTEGEEMEVELTGADALRARDLLQRARSRRDSELGIALEAAGWEVIWSPSKDRVMHAAPPKRD